MHRLFLSFLMIISTVAEHFAADSISSRNIDPRLKVLKQQVLKDILSAVPNKAGVMNLTEKMKSDGSWGDINYHDKTRGGWPVADHLTRLHDMSVMYKRPGSGLTNDPELADKILSGLDFWFKNDFICPNWWYPEIGVPKILGPTMLLMEDKLTPAQMQAGAKILNRARIGMTGQNKVWLSGNVIYRSLLTGNVDSVRAAVASIQEEVIISEGEGIQVDYSFHQHGPQQQFGNYGAAYAADIVKWAILFQNTPFRFTPEKIVILRNYLLDGMRWVVWKNKMDISACGRQLFPNAQTGKALSIGKIYAKMPLVDAGFAKQYMQGLNDFNGNKHFWRSDMTIHRRDNFYASVKMSSRRVAGAESCNDENVQGYHLGDGATYFYQSGNEYTDIFPFWDWKKLPGTTTFYDASALPVLPCSGYRINSDFVGGISDGSNGIATLSYNRDSLKAQKTWFFMDNAIVCMGAGISADESKEVVTTVNQSFLNGNVLVRQAASPGALEMGKHHLNDVSWVLHDNWGYYFPGKTTIEITNRRQSGDWSKVLKRMPSEKISADIFTMWFNHHEKPRAARYAYYVFPGATSANMDVRASTIELVDNTDSLQVIEIPEKQTAGLVFVQSGKATTKLFNKVSAGKPCILMISRKSGRLHVALADPAHQAKEVIIGLAGKKKSQQYFTSYDAGEDVTYFTIKLPEGAQAGKTVRFVVSE